MASDVGAWSISSVLVSVRDLDRSSLFYQDVMNIHEVVRESEIAILGGYAIGPVTLLLREARGSSFRTGQDALGIRALTCDVGSDTELDRVEERLRSLDAFRDRQFFDKAEKFEFVSGFDPDRLPLIFTANEPGRSPTLEDYHQGLVRMYTIDV